MAKRKATSSSSFWDHPVKNIEEALHIRKQIEALQDKLSKIIGGTLNNITPAEPKTPKSKKTAAAKPTSQTSKAPAASASKSATKKPAAKKKSTMSPEARAKIAEAQKARWAAKREAAAEEALVYRRA
jgi:hypothetical protein